jgi:multiple sugar transport system ATP-binding protein
VAAIQLTRLAKIFAGGTVAVRDVTLDIADGELMVLVGPSGCGKSTVLRLIAGLEAPTSGSIRLGDVDLTGVAPQDRDLAMVFQSYALYPHLTVRDNLAFGLRVRRTPPGEIANRIETAARSLGLEPVLDRKPSALSGGQRQRVALGRAIVRDPRAFLFDEPLSNLDPGLRADTRAELALLHRRLRATMVYVTHDQEEAMTLGERIAVMRDGGIEQVGTPVAVFSRPRNTFVARFIGSPRMNLFPGRILANRDGALARCGPLTVAIAARVEREQEVIAGVRPHDFDQADVARADLVGRVTVIEPLGNSTLVYVRPEGANELVRILVSADTPVAVDERFGVRVRPGRLHCFDAHTGGRLETAVDT